MANQFVISDTHFSHKNMLVFKNTNGSMVRPFKDIEEMDEHMVERWNSVVGPNDKVYHLGDVVINKSALPILNRLNGKKKLILGNHDIFGAKEYLKYFYDVAAYKVHKLAGVSVIFSHIPIAPSNLERFKFNIHGHIHGNPADGQSYFCACVEQIDYTPMAFDILEEKLKERL